MSEEAVRQTTIDEEHPRLLSIGYLISAGVTALFSLFGLLYVFIGVVMELAYLVAVRQHSQSPPPAFLGWILGIIGLTLFLLMAGVAILKFRTAQCIKSRKSRIFCMVIAAISCLEFPYGIAPGGLTFLVLGRNSIRRLFEPRQAADN